jgi:acyl carrier protein
MDTQDRIVKAIYSAVDELNKQLPKGTHLEKSPGAVLYGKTGQLESLDFVTFIMEVEEKIKDEFGVDMMITDENLLSKEKSPFSTLGTLTEYLEEILKEGKEASA